MDLSVDLSVDSRESVCVYVCVYILPLRLIPPPIPKPYTKTRSLRPAWPNTPAPTPPTHVNVGPGAVAHSDAVIFIVGDHAWLGGRVEAEALLGLRVGWGREAVGGRGGRE